jgi:hypothetical protein
MPAVLPVTSARFPERRRSMSDGYRTTLMLNAGVPSRFHTASQSGR